MHMYNELVVFVAVFCFANASNLPAEFQRCKRSQENTDECLKVAVQDALPRLKQGIASIGFPSIDPLNIPSMTIGEGTGTVHVVQNFKNVNLFGISEAKVEKIKATIAPTSITFEVDAFISELKLEGDYDLNGRILVLPIVGTGQCTILLRNLTVHLAFSGETFEKKENKYFEIKDTKLTLKPEIVKFDFKNLFGGDERLGAEMNNVLNENWENVFDDVKPGYEKAIAIIIETIANVIFKNDPYNDLFLE